MLHGALSLGLFKKELKKRNHEERKKPVFQESRKKFRESLMEVFDCAGRNAYERKENAAAAEFIEDQVSINH